MILLDLTLEQIAQAMNAARRNAHDLVEDAQTLLDAGRHVRAAALAILSIEESGKVDVLRCLAGARDADDRAAYVKDLLSHRAKNAHWIIGALRREYPFPPLMLTALKGRDGAHAAYLDKLKQSAIYTDVADDGTSKEPKDSIDQSLAQELIQCAIELTSDTITTPRELELFRDRLSACERLEQLPDTITAYYRDLMSEGLWSGDAETLFSRLGFIVPCNESAESEK
jgi:AbiV family abortive infection protein